MSNPFENPDNEKLLDEAGVTAFLEHEMRRDSKSYEQTEKEMNVTVLSNCLPADYEAWDPKSINIYANAVGRLWMDSQTSGRPAEFLTHEYHRLSKRLPQDLKYRAKDLIPMVGKIAKYGRRVNCPGFWSEEARKHELLRRVIKKYQDNSLDYAINNLVNPCGLEVGMDLYAYNACDGSFKNKKITDFELIDDEGILEVDGELDDLWRIHAMLADGRLMTREADNCTSLMGSLIEDTERSVSLVKPGTRIKILTRSVIRQTTYSDVFRVVENNREQLEEKFGKAYLLHAKRFFKAMAIDESNNETIELKDFIGDPLTKVQEMEL